MERDKKATPATKINGRSAAYYWVAPNAEFTNIRFDPNPFMIYCFQQAAEEDERVKNGDIVEYSFNRLLFDADAAWQGVDAESGEQ